MLVYANRKDIHILRVSIPLYIDYRCITDVLLTHLKYSVKIK
jgi:hypothetical protein